MMAGVAGRHLTKYFVPRFCPLVESFFAAIKFAMGFLRIAVSVRSARPISSRRCPGLERTCERTFEPIASIWALVRLRRIPRVAMWRGPRLTLNDTFLGRPGPRRVEVAAPSAS